jgi:NDMA-dependent alcohol dehydrogenase
MQTRAAIIRESPGRFEVVDLELDEPRMGEIQVKLVAAGLCHSDEHYQTGDMPPGHFPMIPGHEGAGVVEAVGPNTPGWEVGDHVLFSFIPSCGKCRWCSEGMTNLCDLGASLLVGGRFVDGTFRTRLADGTEVGQTCGLGTFAERTVVDVDSAIKLDKDLPLEQMCLLGCGVGTGWGSAVYSAETKPGDVIIVMGTGGVGVNAVQGAKHAGATTVIAVDPVEFKRGVALGLGATHAFESIAEADEYAKSITNGQGADKAIVTVGVVKGEHIAQAFAAIRKGGTVVVTGVAAADMEGGIPVHPFELTLMQKRIQGSLFGACNPRSDIKRQIEMYRSGQLKLDELVTTRYPLDDIVLAYEDMMAGRNIRGILVFD